MPERYDRDDLYDIPPMVPDEDHGDIHRSNRRAMEREIVPPARRGRASASSGGVRLLLTVLCILVAGGIVAGYYFYTEYQTDLRQTQLRLNDFERILAATGDDAERSAEELTADIEHAVEQYDLLWANWRQSNRVHDDLRSEIARLELTNTGRDEVIASNNRAILGLSREMNELTDAIAEIGGELGILETLTSDINTIRQGGSGGDEAALETIVLRVDNLEQAIASVDTHRMQINDSLYRMQEHIEELQRTILTPATRQQPNPPAGGTPLQ